MSRDQRLAQPRSPRHPRRRLRQVGRTRNVQPRRHRTLHQRHPITSRHPRRHPHRRPTQPRRPTHRRPRPLASGDLGQHNGLPTSIIVTTTLQELEAGAGRGLTGGGTLLPMSDVIRLGSHAHHYLAIFDKGKALALYHTKRLASPAQRIMLHARDRGCTFPGCTCPATYAKSTTTTPTPPTPSPTSTTWHSPATPTTNKPTTATTPAPTHHGQTEWIPPPHLDRGQPRINTYHHPEKLLREGTTTSRSECGRWCQIRPRSVTALRSSASSAVDLSIRLREKSLMSSPCTMLQSPPLVVTGNDEIRPSGTP